MEQKSRKQFNDIIDVHQSIINNIKVQKARQDKLLKKYEEDVRREMSAPASAFLGWSKVISPYLDYVVSGKIMDYQLIEAYEKFLQDLSDYESEFVLSEAYAQNVEFGMDMSIGCVLRLERKLIDLREAFQKDMVRKQVRLMKLYQQIPDELAAGKGHCTYCGKDLSEETDNYDTACQDCQAIPRNMRPVLRYRKKRPVKKTEEKDESDEVIPFASEETNGKEENKEEPQQEESKETEELASENTEEQIMPEDNNEEVSNENDDEPKDAPQANDEEDVAEEPKLVKESRIDKGVKKEFSKIMGKLGSKYKLNEEENNGEH